MAASFEDLELQARNLSTEERARFAELLLESLRESPLPEIEADWDREISDRVAAYERGEATVYAAEDVLAEARRLAR
jgi:putative addiction module component (TIGR02574 family)